MTHWKDPSETITEFKSCVNMDAKELEEWLKTSDSNKVPLTASYHMCLHAIWLG